VRFNTHSNLAGTHAFLGASSPHWINYSDDKLDFAYTTAQAARRGTELHELAKNCIRLGVRLPDTPTTMNLYVNDAIGFRMTPEQILYYSPNCYGTTDTISFRKNFLRIHDLKSGVTRSPVRQLYVYVALFCLEYEFSPFAIDIETRIYQSDEVKIYVPEPEEIAYIMDKIVTFDKRIEALKLEHLGY
jgi:hypothetical protein